MVRSYSSVRIAFDTNNLVKNLLGAGLDKGCSVTLTDIMSRAVGPAIDDLSQSMVTRVEYEKVVISLFSE